LFFIFHNTYVFNFLQLDFICVEKKINFFSIWKMNWQQVKAAFHAKSNAEVGLFKRCDNYLVKLELCKDTVTNANRYYVQDLRFAKCRASHLKVLQILDTSSGENVDEIVHTWQPRTWQAQQNKIIVYKVGSIVYPDSYERDEDKICAPGIHYFNTLFAAHEYPKCRFHDDGSVLNRDAEFVKEFGFDQLIGA